MQRKQVSGLWACCFLGALAGVLAGACGDRSDAPTSQCDIGSVCRDSDCDFICDITEGFKTLRDTDGDGTPDYLDRDSDGDGVRDRDEAGDEDRLTPPVDRDKNGIQDYLDPAYPLHYQPRPAGAPADTGGSDAPATDAGMGLPPPPEPRDNPSDKPTHPVYQNSSEDALCRSDEALQSQCAADEQGSAECDGLDNDCDGRVDNNALCPCTRGAARSCFAGPADRRGVGACRSGIQHCVGEEFSHWGPCEGSVAPTAEQCDGIDNDCDGCTDELKECTPSLSCPAPGDERVPDAQPFVPYVLDASRFYAGPDAISYRFSIRGSPCDRMFHSLDALDASAPAADAVSGKQSYQVRAQTSTRSEVVFALSGSYSVELVVVTASGELHCSFVVHVRGPGLRVELCWDKTGPAAQRDGDAVDLDLHLGKAGTTQIFETPNDCYWQTCRGDSSPWGYPNTSPLSGCSGPSAQNFATYSQLGFCPNPRLDADNRLDARSRSEYIAENINLDVPSPGDRYRIAVMYKANVLSDVQTDDAGTASSIDTRALVNVYCDGQLLGSFGGDPEQQLDPDAIHLSAPGMLWRVADVAVSNAGCEISPLRDPATQRGYWISSHDVSYGKL